MIAGLEEISSGDMILDGKKINDKSPSDREVAMVFQDYALYGNMTVYQNIGFSLTIRGKSAQAIHDRVMDISKTVELYDYLNRFPKALSGGQRQRVAMGRSLAKHARVLLMDEPLSNLDAKLRQQTRRELSVLHNDLRPTIVYVTHDQVEAMTLASKIVVMNEGRIQQIGSPYEVYHFPVNIFTASFIGAPQINLIRGAFDRNIFFGFNEDTDFVFQFDVPREVADNEDIVLGLRPEVIRVMQENETAEEDDCVFEATVEKMQFLGAEYYTSINTGGCSINVRIPANTNIQCGQNVFAAFNVHKAHFFDEVSGLRMQIK